METIEELFETLDPKQKAAFLDTRLEWATSGALCEEVRERLCTPARFEDMPDDIRHNEQNNV